MIPVAASLQCLSLPPPAVKPKGRAGVQVGLQWLGLLPLLHCDPGDRAVIISFTHFLGLGCGLGNLPNENTVTTPEPQSLGNHPSPLKSQFELRLIFIVGRTQIYTALALETWSLLAGV